MFDTYESKQLPFFDDRFQFLNLNNMDNSNDNNMENMVTYDEFRCLYAKCCNEYQIDIFKNDDDV
jgi:hypothetical protein